MGSGGNVAKRAEKDEKRTTTLGRKDFLLKKVFQNEKRGQEGKRKNKPVTLGGWKRAKLSFSHSFSKNASKSQPLFSLS